MKQALTPAFINKKVFDSAPQQQILATESKQSTAKEPKALKEKQSNQTVNVITEEFIPDKVKLMPYAPGKFRLGLEQTKENYMRLPGTSYRWEPSKIGNTYKTGLHFISPERQAKLARELGHVLNDEFYAEMTYVIDGSNPYGHHMDLTKPRELVVYLAMLESHLVGANKLEKGTGKKPEADWYIENLEAEAEAESLDKDKFLEVTRIYAEMSNEKKAAFGRVLQLPVRGVSPKVADNMLWKKLTDNKQVDYKKTLDKFLAASQWSNEKLNIYAELEDAIAFNIIRRNNAQDYVYGDDILGSTKEQVLSKLLQGENSGLRSIIKSKLAMRL
jgi:hypothetical protein